ncbi:hypothetical protein NDU88_001261 [Pleurodeles waltl]|uniref:Uncharacterized protein n=1 Tax=Pleurodeles waltl TaxID=8319 RepID=A0AAV7NA93_PLEWA|nr:hypothetical protein NDU88_001261 [Pleurodeles waltl]
MRCSPRCGRVRRDRSSLEASLPYGFRCVRVTPPALKTGDASEIQHRAQCRPLFPSALCLRRGCEADGGRHLMFCHETTLSHYVAQK